MATNENLQKYLKLARNAREEGNEEDGKRYYDLARTEDPSNGEAKFFYSFFNLLDSKKGEVLDKFTKLCASIPSCIKLVAESDASDEDKVNLVNEMLDTAKKSLALCDKVQHELKNPQSSDITALNTGRREGLKMFYAFGDAVEKNFSNNPKTMKIAAEAWKEGVAKQQIWYVGVDKTLPEKYAEKIKKVDPAYEMPKKVGCVGSIFKST